MKYIIKYLKRHIIWVFFPFTQYLIFNLIPSECNDFCKYSIGVLFFFFLVISSIYFVIYQTEKVFKHAERSNETSKFLAHTLGIVFFLSLTFASYYWCLFEYNNENFKNVKESEVFLDFLYYSFGVFIMNNTSEIQANSLYAKLFVGTEMMTAFITLILILANFKDLKSKPES